MKKLRVKEAVRAWVFGEIPFWLRKEVEERYNRPVTAFHRGARVTLANLGPEERTVAAPELYGWLVLGKPKPNPPWFEIDDPAIRKTWSSMLQHSVRPGLLLKLMSPMPGQYGVGMAMVERSRWGRWRRRPFLRRSWVASFRGSRLGILHTLP